MKSSSRGFLTALTSLAVILGLAAIPPAASAGENGTDEETPRETTGDAAGTSAMDMVAAMQPGWNLGNTLDAVGEDETAWGNPRVTRRQLAAIRAQGFESIRIPVTWNAHQGGAPDHTINPAHLDRVEEVVDQALDEGFHVMINIHHDSWQWVMNLPRDYDAVMARYTASWEQIAETFRDAPPELSFESVNEPYFEGSSGAAHDAELLHDLNTTFHGIVRDSGGNNADRLLVLTTLHAAHEQERLDELVETFDELDDPHLAATIHYYGFWPFSVNVAGHTRYEQDSRRDMVETFDRLHDTFVSRGIPVIIGEYGLLGFDRHTGTVQQGEKLKFFEDFGHQARIRDLTTMWWDNGQHFDRRALEWNDPALYRQISTSWTTASATASTDQIFVRGSAPVTDAEITLDTAGHTLTAVRHGSRELRRGTAYTLNGDRLTISAATLSRLTARGGQGVNATLTLEFSGGAPWDVRIITHETPQLSNASGTTNSLVIPTRFNGDQLATMEAVYADGGNAGPHDWTSFKEFEAAFSPDYEAGRITLPSAFFNGVRDDSTVNLTFHFWSGDTVTYTLTRSGNTVTGTAG
ncbi:cellulase family glycosylhydrolase [Streptomyces calidiresistens]|uniref:Cellulase family glycosylhydrolase n=1 Tax=Streptomyces calidiresistens TaxID=1485586 RepID=A0A7W3T7D7_9ACTN|nr:cellulase family glycosylhydrolase [Streptomyces calidiresistens]MBB0232309.1 cellulase family glycosylhydrolase [Streptomyces calidiresistens]